MVDNERKCQFHPQRKEDARPTLQLPLELIICFQNENIVTATFQIERHHRQTTKL